MIYALSKSELAQLRGMQLLPSFHGAEMLIATYRTDPEVVARILPKPLRPGSKPIATAFVARYPETNFGCVYNEGALLLVARYGSEEGLYCLSMPVTDDMAMIGGRESLGFPKKIAEEITLERDGDQVVGRVVRRGTEILKITCSLGDEPADLDAMGLGSRATDLDGRPCRKGVSFLFKHFPSANGRSFDYRPRLVRQVTLFTPRADLRTGAAQISVTSSVRDPLGEVPVREVLGCIYGTWDNTMLPGRVVCQPRNVFRYLPHAFFKSDLIALLIDNPPPRAGILQRLALRRKIRSY